jgi:rhodanese-related sulfurtransferase
VQQQGWPGNCSFYKTKKEDIMTRSINIKELNGLLERKSALTLIDVRRKTDYNASSQKIINATWHDPEEIDTWIKQLPVDNLTVAYCVKGGSVSQSVADRLQQGGLKSVFLEGGLKAWIENRQPVEEISASQNGHGI